MAGARRRALLGCGMRDASWAVGDQREGLIIQRYYKGIVSEYVLVVMLMLVRAMYVVLALCKVQRTRELARAGCERIFDTYWTVCILSIVGIRYMVRFLMRRSLIGCSISQTPFGRASFACSSDARRAGYLCAMPANVNYRRGS
ncbi:hypothetical protein K504DRAFT_460896 [Pleomassaria siparia CBS 279.74]|uniref:Uncharacterized protein n=1 Tax=Pleomassaria siparia CBS 279.74 TaxID=1314801 RepID=A0A6G1JXA4_9PLEO|nr:hypothetical protein K504DRAFT_460896 [Pleomassaria siparia CBS 279.74]